MSTITMTGNLRDNSDIFLIEGIMKKFLSNFSFTLKEAKEDDSLMTKEEFFSKIDKARAGKDVAMSLDDMKEYLRNKANSDGK